MSIELCVRPNGGVGQLHMIQLLTVEFGRVARTIASYDVDRKVKGLAGQGTIARTGDRF